jgi:divalent metal cation (Fe/Co/Zn/Cd) transporter
MIADREAARERLAKLALNSELHNLDPTPNPATVNTVVNFLLVCAKGVAVWYSSSISLIASLVDSALDLLSTFIILGTSWAMGVPSDRHLVSTYTCIQSS